MSHIKFDKMYYFSLKSGGMYVFAPLPQKWGVYIHVPRD